MHPTVFVTSSSQTTKDVETSQRVTQVSGLTLNNSQSKNNNAVEAVFPLTISHIVIGGLYFHDCPQQPLIPVFLIVTGVFKLAHGLIGCFSTKKVAAMAVYTLLSLFLFCWFICGSVWIYSIYPANYNNTMSSNQTAMGMGMPYCHKTLYLYAFWTTTLMYILLAVGLLLFVICGTGWLVALCCYCCAKKDTNADVSA